MADRSRPPSSARTASWTERSGGPERRRTRRGLDALQLRILRAAAGRRAEVYCHQLGSGGRHPPARRGTRLVRGPGVGQMRPVELIVAERRLVGRVCAEAESQPARPSRLRAGCAWSAPAATGRTGRSTFAGRPAKSWSSSPTGSCCCPAQADGRRPRLPALQAGG